MEVNFTTMEEFKNASREEQKAFLQSLFQHLSDREIARRLGSDSKRDALLIYRYRRAFGLEKGRGWHLRKLQRRQTSGKPVMSAAASASGNGSSQGSLQVRLTGSFTSDTLADYLKSLASLLDTIGANQGFEVTVNIQEANGRHIANAWESNSWPE